MKISTCGDRKELVWLRRIFCHFNDEMATPGLDEPRGSISIPLACVWWQGFLRLLPKDSRDNF